MNTLSDTHRRELKASAISDEVIAQRGYATVVNPRAVPSEYFADYQRLPGWLVPIRDVTGSVASMQLKPDQPRADRDTGKPIKYESAAHGRNCVDVPESVRPLIKDRRVPLWVTEGCKKVDSAISNGIPCIVGLTGVWNWLSERTRLPDWDEIPLKGREVVLAFDSDVMTSDKVRAALERFSRWLAEIQGANVRYLILPPSLDGSKVGLDDYFAAGGTRLELDQHIVDELPKSEIDWDAPIPIDPMAGPPPPLEALPGTLGRFVEAVAEETQTPPDLALCAALAALGAADRGKTVVSVPALNWEEPVHIMTVPTAKPATRKSQIIRRVFDPIPKWERARWEIEGPQLRQWESRNRVLEKQLASAENAVGKPREGESIQDAEAIRMAAVEELHQHQAKRPVLTRVITDDATPEAVKSMMAEQGGAIAVVSAESAFLSNIAGRYSNSPDLDVLLKGHAGDSIVVDRKRQLPEHVDRACLSLCVMAQPKVIADLGAIDGFRDRGGAARLLAVFPQDLLGTRRLTATPVPDLLERQWEAMLTRILDTPPRDEPRRLVLSAPALDQFQTFREWHEPQLRADSPLSDIQDWFGKLPGAVLRLAGLLHLAQHEDAEAQPISAETIRNAIALGNYFTEHARLMYRMMHGHQGQSEAAIVLGVLKNVEGESISRRDLFEKVKGRSAFATVSSLVPALNALEEFGWIRREQVGKGSRGRPSEIIHFHPDIHSRKPQKPDPPPSESVIADFADRFSEPRYRPTGTDGAVGPKEVRI